MFNRSYKSTKELASTRSNPTHHAFKADVGVNATMISFFRLPLTQLISSLPDGAYF